MNLAVVGAGHAGVEAAATAAAAGHAVTLLSAEDCLPYYRPQLVARAFDSSPDEQRLWMHPDAWYRERKIDLRAGAPVEGVDVAAMSVQFSGARRAFDAVVLATGAGPSRPRVEGIDLPGVMTLWSLEDARRIAALARPGLRLVVLGGGLIGVETALRAAGRGLAVTLCERCERLMALQLGAGASAVLRHSLEALAIRVELGVSVTGIRAQPGGTLAVERGERPPIPADLVVVSTGVRRNLDMAAAAGLRCGWGITVDSLLRTSAQEIYACGDIAQTGLTVRCSASEAVKQGRVAGWNAVARASGVQSRSYEDVPDPVFLKHAGIEVHAIGMLAGDTRLEDVQDVTTPGVFRCRVLQNGHTVGVQVVGASAGFVQDVQEVRKGYRELGLRP